MLVSEESLRMATKQCRTFWRLIFPKNVSDKEFPLGYLGKPGLALVEFIL